MKVKQLLCGFWAGIAMILLILDSETATAAARSGVQLCLGTLIPVLLPFFLLSNLLSRSLLGASSRFFRPLVRICRIPAGAESLLLPAFLGGYPMGAQAIAEAHRTGQLSEGAALRMLVFCSNAGPAFLLGVLAPVFPEKWMAPSLWGIHIVSAILTGILYPGSQADEAVHSAEASSPPDAMLSAMKGIAVVCGWVICFKVISGFLSKWFLGSCPAVLQVISAGILELAGGCAMLQKISDIGLRYVICAGLTSLGGLCVLQQTISVLNGLPIRTYLQGKLLQCLLSILLAASLIYGRWQFPAAGLLIVISCIFLRNSRIPAESAV